MLQRTGRFIMTISNIGLATIAPATGTSTRSNPSPPPLSDGGDNLFRATEPPDRIDGQCSNSEKTAERVISPATLTAAKLRGYGDFVDKRV